MAFFTWSEDLSVGVALLDSQHRVLVKILNDLHEAMRTGDGERVAGALLEKLVEYTREHLGAEEKLMEAARYPEFPEHRIQHIVLTSKVTEMVGRQAEGGCARNVELLMFLRDWLQTHILRQDKAYSGWLIAHGVHGDTAEQLL